MENSFHTCQLCKNHWLKYEKGSKHCQIVVDVAKQVLSTVQVHMWWDPTLPVFMTRDTSEVGGGIVISYRLAEGSEKPTALKTHCYKNWKKQCKVWERGFWHLGIKLHRTDIRNVSW